MFRKTSKLFITSVLAFSSLNLMAGNPSNDSSGITLTNNTNFPITAVCEGNFIGTANSGEQLPTLNWPVIYAKVRKFDVSCNFNKVSKVSSLIASASIHISPDLSKGSITLKSISKSTVVTVNNVKEKKGWSSKPLPGFTVDLSTKK